MLRSNWFQILLALADDAAHGSEVARRVKAQTAGATTLWPATLYRTLDEMTDAGLIEELVGDRHPDGVSAKRRYYGMTAKGRSSLKASADQMAAWAQTVARHLRHEDA